jgi:hypothetical protein
MVPKILKNSSMNNPWWDWIWTKDPIREMPLLMMIVLLYSDYSQLPKEPYLSSWNGYLFGAAL